MSHEEESEERLLSWSRPSRLAGVGLVLAAAAWAALAGPVGLVLAGVLAGATFALTPPFAFAIGQVLVLGLSTELSIVGGIAAEVGLVLILLSELTTTRRYRLWAEAVALTALAVGLGYAAVVAGVGLWPTVAASIVIWSVLAYGLHRFELVQLSLVTEDS